MLLREVLRVVLLEVLQLKPRFELKGQFSLCMDLLQVTTRFEMGNGGVDQRLVVDCFELENSLLVAVLSKKKRAFLSRDGSNIF
jgi:hypothetical protein